MADGHDMAVMACVDPISGQYCLLSHLLYYCLLILSVFAQEQTRLIAGDSHQPLHTLALPFTPGL